MDPADAQENRDLLDSYDYVRANNLSVAMVKELARSHPSVFIDVTKTLQGGVVAVKLMGTDGKTPIDWTDVDQLVIAGKMLDAIRKIRELSGAKVEEAKGMAENRRALLSKGNW